MENKFANKGIEGINIYRDKKGQVVYLDPFTKNGYVITPQKEKTFKTLNNVLLYTALVGVFSYALFEFGLPVTVLAMAGVGGFLEWRFRKFLNNCTVIRGFKPEKKHRLIDSEQSDKLVIIKTVMYIVLAGLLIATTVYYRESDKLVNGVSIACAVVCVFIAGKYISIMISRKR